MILDVVKAAVILLLAAVAQLTVLNPLEILDGPADLLLCTLVGIALLPFVSLVQAVNTIVVFSFVAGGVTATSGRNLQK